MNQAPEVLDESQATVALSDVYEGEEVAAILATADESGIFEDELILPGSNGYHRMTVAVRAHQMSVNEPVSYTIVWS